MNTFNIHNAKTHFSQLINQALSGEEVVIVRGHTPVARIVPYEQNALPPRKGGQLRGMMSMSEDFDAPLPTELINSFYLEEKDKSKED